MRKVGQHKYDAWVAVLREVRGTIDVSAVIMGRCPEMTFTQTWMVTS